MSVTNQQILDAISGLGARVETLENGNNGGGLTDTLLSGLGQVNGLAQSVNAGASALAETVNNVNEARFVVASLTNPAMGHAARVQREQLKAAHTIAQAEVQASQKIAAAQGGAREAVYQAEASRPDWMLAGGSAGLGLFTRPEPVVEEGWSTAAKVGVGVAVTAVAVGAGVAIGRAYAGSSDDTAAFDEANVIDAQAAFG